jgi:hypothetical protein
VLILAWFDEKTVYDILDMSLPESRFMINMPDMPIDDAKQVYARLRERCPRHQRPQEHRFSLNGHDVG